MNEDSRKQVLKIRCSDGLTTKPTDLYNKIVHEVRLPGGILFPELCAAHFQKKVVVKLLRGVILFAVQKLIDFKSPSEIILMAHDPCGTANILNMDRYQVFAKHLEWQMLLQKKYPHLLVRVMFEEHSACGNTRRPHFYVEKKHVEESVAEV